MSLRIVLTDDFNEDVDLQQDWYTEKENEELGLAYVRRVEATLKRLSEHPNSGTACRFQSEKLAGLRRCILDRPFQANLIFYRVEGADFIAFRALSGWRDLPRRLLEPPGTI